MSEIIGKIKSIHWNQLLVIMLIAAIVVGSEGCKSTGKLSKKERKAQIEAAKKELKAIIDGTSTRTLDQQEKYLADVMQKNYNDPELNELIIQATQTIKKAFAERDKQYRKDLDEARAALFDLLQNKDNKTADQLEAELNKIKASYKHLKDEEIFDLYSRVEKKIESMRGEANVPLKQQIEKNFKGIADAGRSGNLTLAASLIKSTLPYFVSEDVPVLIIISREGDIVDYDKPTTIKRYLDFLRDQKESRNAVDSYQLDNNGKIKELDLIKK